MVPFIPYKSGNPSNRVTPLGRYLPPIPDGVVTQWISENLIVQNEKIPEGWILDPFGSTPLIAIEAARAGYRVLVAANNPIARFLIEMAANPPSKAELIGALAELAGTKKGNERLEPHIKSLYRTICDQCQREVIAESFLWEKQAEGEPPILFARQYHCPYCEKKGEFPAIQADVDFAAQFSASKLHFARALERVAQKDDPYRDNAIEALSAYLPRAIYALFTMINKLDSISLPADKLRLLYALLLSTCDYSSTLWPYPAARSRPRQLMIPTRFRENNVWFSMEQSINLWAKNDDGDEKSIDIRIWPDTYISSGGICIFEGRFKELSEHLNEFPIHAVISAIPRPNQPFWTLSALWGGWLWGKEGVGAFKNVLRRRRYDWAWHRYALQTTFTSITENISDDIPFLGLVGEAEPGFITALFSAANNANLFVSGVAMRPESGQLQVIFKKNFSKKNTNSSRLSSSDEQLSFGLISKAYYQETLSNPAREYLRMRGEPSSYLALHTAILADLAHKHLLQFTSAGFSKDLSVLQGESSQTSHEELAKIHHMLEQSLSFRNGFLRYGGSEKSVEAGSWWLRQDKIFQDYTLKPPLADRVEMSIIRFLQTHPFTSIQEIEKSLCIEFPGLLTPSPELIQVCLESYGEQKPLESNLWKLRPQDEASKRIVEISEMNSLLNQIAQSLGFQIQGKAPIIMRDDQGDIQFIWYIITTGVVSPILLGETQEPQKSLIILPGGRANLVAYKIQRDARLRQAVENGWRFVKFRQLRLISKSIILSKSLLEEQLNADLLTYTAPQLRLL